MSSNDVQGGRWLSLPRLLRGGVWIAADNWSQQLLQFISFLYIGNIIGPAATGEITVAITYVLLMQALLVNAVTDSIIQRDVVAQEHEEAVFWANTGMGFLAMIVSLPLAPLAAVSLGEPQVAPLIMAISPVCLAMGMISFFEAKIRRELRFSKLAGRSIVSVGTAFLVAIALAHGGFGVWSLVAYQLVWRVVELIFVARIAAWRPKGRLSVPHFREMLGYSLHNLGIRLVDFLAQNAGRIFVGYFFGMHALGIYQLARRLVEVPLNAGSGVFQNLMLPVLARLQGDRRALGEAVAQTVQAASFALVPAFVGLALVAPILLHALLRPEWAPAAQLVQIFAFGGLSLALTYFFGTALLALGRVRLVFIVNVALLLIRIVLYSLLAFVFGLVGLVMAEACIAALGLVVWYILFDRETDASLDSMVGRALPILFATLIMAVAVEIFRQAAGGHLPPVMLLTGMIAAGLTSFAATALGMARSELTRLLESLRARR